MTITEILNIWNDLGVFSYVIPFLLIFAIIYAILEKSKILGDENKGILAIVAVSVGLLALQFDFVSEFYAIIFPRFGIGLSIFLVLVILIGFFHPTGANEKNNKYVSWIGWLTGVGVAIWSLSAWDDWNNYSGFGGWFSDYVWSLLILGVIVATIIGVANRKEKTG